MTRPEQLPDYTDPPLDEVALGVQFVPVPNYTSVFAWKVWELFKAEYPEVQELPPINTQFETFGGLNLQPSLQFHLGVPPVKSRLWFISPDENHLLQYQADMFLLNWRKHPNPQPYPHFEEIISAFGQNLQTLKKYFDSDFSYQININQAEVTYINIIPVESFSAAGDWFSLWDGKGLELEALNTSFDEIIRDQGGKPFARLKHEIQSVITVDGKQKALRVSLTYRGRPATNDIDSALDFLKEGRERIVTRFDYITTNKAHYIWGKKK